MITKIAKDKTFDTIIKKIKDIWGIDLSYMELRTTVDNWLLPGRWEPGVIFVGWYKPVYMMKHELGHEVYEMHLTKEQKAKYDKQLQNFTTPYLQEFEPEHTAVERFAEFFVSTLT